MSYVIALERRGNTHDIFLRNGDFAFAEGKKAYAAIIEAAVLTEKGELIYNVNEGVAHLDTAFVSPTNLRAWASAVKDRIRRIPFVKDIVSFRYEFNSDSGDVDYQASIDTDDGIVEVAG